MPVRDWLHKNFESNHTQFCIIYELRDRKFKFKKKKKGQNKPLPFKRKKKV